MLNVIDFLERVGQDAQLRHASKDDVELALANTHIDQGMQAAILAGDQSRLKALLECAPLMSMQFPGKEDEEEDEDEDTEESPSQEGEKMALQPMFRSVASVA
jgi:hypothetical protein